MHRPAAIAVLSADVKGSSKLPDALQRAVQAVIRKFAAVARHREGVVTVKPNGDGLFAAGTEPLEIVRMALDLRQAFWDEDWTAHGFQAPPLLRLGLDYGQGAIDETLAERDVSGLPASRATRIEKAANTCEVWSSASLHEFLKPVGTLHWTEIGVRELQDFGPERLYAINRASEATRATAPAAAAAAEPTAAPAQATPRSAPVTATEQADRATTDAGHVCETVGIESYPVPMPLLGRELPLCLIQLAPSLGDIVNNRTHAGAVAAAETLLRPDASGASLLANRLRTPVVVWPEYAFRFHDWDLLDDLVAADGRPKIVIAPFGPVTGHELKAWQNGGAGTGTRRSLIEPDDPTVDDTFNALWCWVRQPSGATTCYCALKTYLEQHVEPDLISGTGRVNLALEFEDVILLPAICAELLSDQHVNTTLYYQNHLSNKGSTPVLVTASLYQDPPWKSIWPKALTDLTKVAPGPMVIAIANQAFDKLHPEDRRDDLRTLTGVYCDRPNTLPPAGRAKQAGRAFHRAAAGLSGPSLAAAVARCTEPMILFGEISFAPYTSATTRPSWNIKSVEFLGPDARPALPDAATYEVERLLRRRESEFKTVKQKSGVAALITRMKAAGTKTDRIAPLCLGGPSGERLTCTDPIGPEQLSRLVSALKHTLHLAGDTRMTWCEDAKSPSVLAYRDGVPVLVWNHAESGKKQCIRLEEWAKEAAHPHTLLVFGRKNSDVVAGGGAKLRSGGETARQVRPQVDFTDIGEQAAANENPHSVDAPGGVRRVVMIDADEIEGACEEDCDEAEAKLYDLIDRRLEGKSDD